MSRARFAVVSLVIIICTPLALADDPLVTTINVSRNQNLSDIPMELRKGVAISAAKEEMLQFLKGQPILVIDGAALSVDLPTVGSSQTLSVSRLELRNGGRIVTNGINLEIIALSLISQGGEILSFEGAASKVAGAAPEQSNGTSGLSAGTLVLNGALDGSSTLKVTLHGQEGQIGGKGITGPLGAQGARGEDGAERLAECLRPGGNGREGSQGGQGGSAGNGGNGGNGGRLILRGDLAAQRTQLQVSLVGGKGGAEGLPGDGGQGGPGGLGGNGNAVCRAGVKGGDGRQGDLGPLGKRGEDGGTGMVATD